eukprot:scpid90028/ scgid20095/ 
MRGDMVTSDLGTLVRSALLLDLYMEGNGRGDVVGLVDVRLAIGVEVCELLPTVPVVTLFSVPVAFITFGLLTDAVSSVFGTVLAVGVASELRGDNVEHPFAADTLLVAPVSVDGLTDVSLGMLLVVLDTVCWTVVVVSRSMSIGACLGSRRGEEAQKIKNNPLA